MSDAIRLGVVGAGSIAIRGLFPHLTMADVQDRVNVVAVCDPVLDRAQAAAGKFGMQHAFATFEELLDANVVDAVSIASPIGFHYEQGMQAVEQGLHVHFNKTMTTTVDEADNLIAAAAAKGVKLVSSPGEMNRPGLQRVKELIDEGALGRLTWAITVLVPVPRSCTPASTSALPSGRSLTIALAGGPPPPPQIWLATPNPRRTAPTSVRRISRPAQPNRCAPRSPVGS